MSQTIPEHAPPPSPLSLPTSPARPSNPMPNSLLQPLHTRLNQKSKQGEIMWHQTVLIYRSASQPVRSSSPPPSPSSLHHHHSSSPPPPAPSGGGDGAELRTPLSRKPNSRSSMPSGRLFLKLALYFYCDPRPSLSCQLDIFCFTQENLPFLCHFFPNLRLTCPFIESTIFPQPTLGSR